jgi:hypothetical protein
MPALVPDLLSLLRAHSLVQSLRVVHYDETPMGKVELKVRCRLLGGYQFQVWLHHEPAFQDYAYQLFTDHPLLRWDNAPHYPDVVTAPHHFHNEAGDVSASSLGGDPIVDLLYVLVEIETWIKGRRR